MDEDEIRGLLARPCSRSRCVGGCVCADTWAEVDRLRKARDIGYAKDPHALPEALDVSVSIPKDQRWVCAACGKYTHPGESRLKFRDVSCAMNAVLCWADRTIEGWWEPVNPDDGAPSSGCQSFKT